MAEHDRKVHKCMADVSLLADIIISKYVYHLPFYRVIETYKELGVTISASTINDWFKAVVGKVKPLYEVESEADALDEKEGKPDYERRKALRQEKAYPEIKKFKTWMEDVLHRMPEYERGQKDFADLLPGNWVAARAK